MAGLVGEVIGAGVPILQLHVTERGLRADQQLDGADVQAGCVGVWPRRSLPRAWPSFPLRGRTSVWLKSARCGSDRPIRLWSGSSILNAGAARKARSRRSRRRRARLRSDRSAGRTARVIRCGSRACAMVADQRRQVAEEHALAGQLFVEDGLCPHAVDVGHAAGELRAVGEQRREFRGRCGQRRPTLTGLGHAHPQPLSPRERVAGGRVRGRCGSRRAERPAGRRA